MSDLTKQFLNAEVLSCICYLMNYPTANLLNNKFSKESCLFSSQIIGRNDTWVNNVKIKVLKFLYFILRMVLASGE